jgi:hypothetical protein
MCWNHPGQMIDRLPATRDAAPRRNIGRE